MERMKIGDSAAAIFPWDIRINYDVMIFQNVNIKLDPRFFIATIHTIHYPDMAIFFSKTGVKCFYCARAKVNYIFNLYLGSQDAALGCSEIF